MRRAAIALFTAVAMSCAQASAAWRYVVDRADGTLYLNTDIERPNPGTDALLIRTQVVHGSAARAARTVYVSLISCERNRELVLSTETVDQAGRSRGRSTASDAELGAALERMRREPPIEYSARLAPLCAAIASQVARGGVRERGVGGQSDVRTVRSVPLVRGPGVWGVRARINGAVPVTMLVDSGASTVALTPEVVRALREAGALSDGDATGRRVFRTADGRAHESLVLRLRSIELDGLVLRDVVAVVLPEGSGASLLGQSFLGRLRHWSLNRATQTFDYMP